MIKKHVLGKWERKKIRKKVSRGNMLPSNITVVMQGRRKGLPFETGAIPLRDRKNNLKQLSITVKVPVVSKPTGCGPRSRGKCIHTIAGWHQTHLFKVSPLELPHTPEFCTDFPEGGDMGRC